MGLGHGGEQTTINGSPNMLLNRTRGGHLTLTTHQLPRAGYRKRWAL